MRMQMLLALGVWLHWTCQTWVWKDIRIDWQRGKKAVSKVILMKLYSISFYWFDSQMEISIATGKDKLLLLVVSPLCHPPAIHPDCTLTSKQEKPGANLTLQRSRCEHLSLLRNIFHWKSLGGNSGTEPESGQQSTLCSSCFTWSCTGQRSPEQWAMQSADQLRFQPLFPGELVWWVVTELIMP